MRRLAALLLPALAVVAPVAPAGGAPVAPQEVRATAATGCRVVAVAGGRVATRATARGPGRPVLLRVPAGAVVRLRRPVPRRCRRGGLRVGRGAAVTPGPAADAPRLWLAPVPHAVAQAAAWRAVRPQDAAAMERLAAIPQAVWLTGDAPSARAVTAEVTAAAAAAGRVAVLVAYAIPGRDCGAHSAGGEPDGGRYRAWVAAVAAAIRGTPIVVLEPDALALADCLPAAAREQRLDLLRDAAAALRAAGARVYVDAGHAAWHPAEEAAARLRRVGATHFALNVSNFGRTADEAAYGRRVAALLGPGAGFVLDTSRNGNGRLAGEWCNPPGRAVGQAPTLTPAEPGVDALLWVKRPGESDGPCAGGPRAGTWWPEAALALVRAR